MKQGANASLLKHRLRKASPIILTVISAVGMTVTVISAVKATPKATELLRKAEEEKQEKLTKTEIIETAGKCYISTVVIGSATIACLFAALLLGQREQQALIAAYTMLDSSYREYRRKTEELYGEEADDNVRAAIISDKHNDEPFVSDGEKCVFYEEFYGEFFEMTKEELLLAELELNRTFALNGAVTLNSFYSYLGLDEKEIGDELGWSQCAGWEFYGYAWIDFVHKKHRLDDGMEYYIITMPFPPTADYEDY